MDTFGIHFAVVILASCTILVPASDGDSGPISNTPSCDVSKDVTAEYRDAIYEFVISTYKKATSLNKFQVVYSPLTMWTTLAAIAEGVESQTQQELFKILNLPNDICARQQYYRLATSLVWPGEDIQIAALKYFVFDEGLTVNANWQEFVSRNSLLDISTAPIKAVPKNAIDEMRNMVSAKLNNINIKGNSVLLEAIDFGGLWTEAFSNAMVEQAPFYSQNGEKLGAVDLMRMRKRVKMGYVSSIGMKILELPLGVDERYSLIYGIMLGDTDDLISMETWNGSTIHEAMASLHESDIPLDVGIPQLIMTSELDVRAILEDMGVNNLWKDPSVTSSISEPGALPSSYIQRVTISIDTAGVNPAPSVAASPVDTPTGLDPMVGRDFIANKPYMVGLYDKKTRTCLIAASVSQPTYPL